MLGNDVVDLELAKRQCNWRRQGYLPKLFSLAEQGMIKDATNSDQAVWLMWSMKEAVYKILNRKNGQRSYQPIAFNCSFELDINAASGIVRYEDNIFLTSTTINEAFVHTIALANNCCFSEIQVIKQHFQPNYLQVFNANNTLLVLRKNIDLLPEIVDMQSGFIHPASVSHHGKWVFIVY